MIAIVLSILLLLVASFQGVIIPVLAESYESAYFVCIMSTIQFSLFLIIAHKIYKRYHDANNRRIGVDGGYARLNDDYDQENNAHPDRAETLKASKRVMMYSGFYMSLSTLFNIYSANPERTPIILQLILNGLNIVPSFLLTKYYLEKQVEYNKKYCFWSIITLIMSISISILPIDDISFSSFFWPMIFLIGQVMRITGYILQEKYFMLTNDRSNYNKVYNISYTRAVQMFVTLLFFWLDLVFGYETSFSPLANSFKTIFEFDFDFIMLELFVISSIIFCVVAGYLNSISTNYSSVALTLATPVVGAVFSIFPSLNYGDKYPIYVTVPSLALSLLSSILWMKGERH